MKIARNIFAALALMLFIISFSVTLTLNFRPLYYFDINYLDIESLSGYSEEEIRENYDALIDYNSMFNRNDTLEFPTLPMSETARIHFEDVKDIFVVVEYIMLITAVISVVMILLLRFKYHDVFYLKLASILTIVIPSVLAICIGLNWEQAFVTFHHIFFDNDYWLFSPKTDPIILMLPDEFFFHCATMILIIVILGSLLSYLIYRRLHRKQKNI